jgi:hypothetical protein
MKKQLLSMAALAILVAAAAMPNAAHGAVAGPSGAIPNAAQTLDATEQVRRVCSRQLRCQRMFQCRWERVCRFTPDYPPRRRR